MSEEKSHNRSQIAVLGQYKSYIQDLGNIGTRHENSRRFYISVVSALFVFLSLSGGDGTFLGVKFAVQVIVGVVGVIVCILWWMHMQSFLSIYRAKFDVLREIEENQKFFHIFEREWLKLNSDHRYKYIEHVDFWLPVVFALLFIAILFL